MFEHEYSEHLGPNGGMRTDECKDERVSTIRSAHLGLDPLRSGATPDTRFGVLSR